MPRDLASTSEGEPVETLTRVIGRFRAPAEGPLVVSIAGIHGNEPAGIHACRRVLRALEARRPAFRGEWLALAGNVAALGRGRRFIDEDLNRIWLTERIEAASAGGRDAGGAEGREREALLGEIEAALARNSGEVHVIDLHTTSAPGSPFSVFEDALANRRLAERLPGSMVLGLEEHLQGTLIEYVGRLGHVAVGFEAGHHDDPDAAAIHELAIWRTLTAAGCLNPAAVPASVGPGPSRFGTPPRVVEILYRHGVAPSDGFVMEPGFQNMQGVKKGELMARDRSGEILAPRQGRVLMPLYQSQGSDGFFIVRERRRIWLRISTAMRRLGLDRLAPRLPGVERHPDLDDAVIVRRRAADGWIVGVLHLCGYRKLGGEPGALVMRRRREAARP